MILRNIDYQWAHKGMVCNQSVNVIQMGYQQQYGLWDINNCIVSHQLLMKPFILNESSICAQFQQNHNDSSSVVYLHRPQINITHKYGSHSRYRRRQQNERIVKNILHEHDNQEYQFEPVINSSDQISDLQPNFQESCHEAVVEEQPEDYHKLLTNRTPSSLLFKFQVSSSDEQPSDSKQNQQVKKPNNVLVIENLQTLPALRNVETISEKRFEDPHTLIMKLLKQNKLKFVKEPLPENMRVEAQLIVDGSGKNFLYPFFSLELVKNSAHLLSCKKQIGSIGGNYYFSIQNTGAIQKNKNYIGKLRNTKDSNIYNIFQSLGNSRREQKCLLASVQVKVQYGVKKIQVYCLKDSIFFYSLKGYSKRNNTTLIELHNLHENRKLITVYRSRQAYWSQNLQSYTLDFSDRVQKNSSKNFIIEDPITEMQVLAFGKISDSCYSMDIAHPFSVWMATALAIVQFD